jgi:hypothetical protein
MESDADQPGAFHDADAASLRGQTAYLHWTRTRLLGALLGAVGGISTWEEGRVNIWGLVALIGFVVALAAELVLLVNQPERDWYSGRAVAESVKTLAWRYAVAADPFPTDLDEQQARDLLRDRLHEVTIKGRDRIVLRHENPIFTPAMASLRSSTFSVRKDAYLKGRANSQQVWYSNKATFNKKRAEMWRSALVILEVVAIAVAAGRAFGEWEIDWASIFAAAIAAGAAWVGVKQHSTIASAYSIAAEELAMASDRVAATTETQWSGVVDDTEEAISREHTMWLASYTHATSA